MTKRCPSEVGIADKLRLAECYDEYDEQADAEGGYVVEEPFHARCRS